MPAWIADYALIGDCQTAGLVDELSLVIAPSVEGVPGGPSVFDIHGGSGRLSGTGMALECCQVLQDGQAAQRGLARSGLECCGRLSLVW